MARLGSVVRWLAIVLVGGYVVVVAGLFFGQRALLFQAHGRGELDTPGTLAIPGSTRVSIPTADGETLAGWYLAPKPGREVFLFFHGQGGWLHRKRGRWRRIRDHGAGILAFSYRGYPGSSGSPSEAGLHEDGRAVYRWLRQRVGADRIVLHGQSLGTGVATRLGAEVEARALILETPFTSVVEIAATRYPLVPVEFFMWDRFVSVAWIGKVQMPVLIAHGTADRVVPFAHGKKMYELAQSAKIKEFIRMPGSRHLTLTRDGLYPHIWRFLARLPTAERP